MEDFNLNIEGDDDNIESISVNNPKQEKFLADFTKHEISKAFTEISSEKRVCVIPIGFPQAGKSLLLSSLMYYGRQGVDSYFRVNVLQENFYKKGRLAFNQMVEYFDKGKLYEATSKGTLDLIGLDLKPTNKKMPNLKMAFLDLAGEDIKSIKVSEKGEFTDKIDAAFNGLQIDNSPIIFSLITPFSPPLNDNETLADAHGREDSLHYDFLNYLETTQPKIMKNASFVIIVSQWDLNNDESITAEEYIKKYRPSIFNYVKNANVTWGSYSVGKLLVTNDNGIKMVEIVRKNIDYPARLWRKLYQLSTGLDLEKKGFWEKLFG
ncbi:hypothetical protein [Psychroflexus salis]|uniref:Uncharacterized protein n=1 Tax=Psychroflexus salis TaxID=1526574 RepID=A0A916ZSH3_9FLAO|nr:hypothetical protein [Psychroflexus salis]GGE09196.1 hypothetical protein GCM10010831_08450 [Psychroflexus salis]